MMNDKRAINEILKNYGKEIHKARIDCVESHIEERPMLISRISYRRMMKRCVLVVLILALTFSILVIGANALGIKFLNLTFFEKETYTQVTSNEDNNDTKTFRIYEPTYIPKGYELVEKDEIEGESIFYSYKNEKDEILFIAQSKTDSFSVQMDNEDCDVTTDTILDMEVRIYKYGGDKQDCTYLMKKEATYIQIVSVMTNKEIRKIIYNLK